MFPQGSLPLCEGVGLPDAPPGWKWRQWVPPSQGAAPGSASWLQDAEHLRLYFPPEKLLSSISLGDGMVPQPACRQLTRLAHKGLSKTQLALFFQMLHRIDKASAVEHVAIQFPFYAADVMGHVAPPGPGEPPPSGPRSPPPRDDVGRRPPAAEGRRSPSPRGIRGPTRAAGAEAERLLTGRKRLCRGVTAAPAPRRCRAHSPGRGVGRRARPAPARPPLPAAAHRLQENLGGDTEKQLLPEPRAAPGLSSAAAGAAASEARKEGDEPPAPAARPSTPPAVEETAIVTYERRNGCRQLQKGASGGRPWGFHKRSRRPARRSNILGEETQRAASIAPIARMDPTLEEFLGDRSWWLLMQWGAPSQSEYLKAIKDASPQEREELRAVVLEHALTRDDVEALTLGPLIVLAAVMVLAGHAYDAAPRGRQRLWKADVLREVLWSTLPAGPAWPRILPPPPVAPPPRLAEPDAPRDTAPDGDDAGGDLPPPGRRPPYAPSPAAPRSPVELPGPSECRRPSSLGAEVKRARVADLGPKSFRGAEHVEDTWRGSHTPTRVAGDRGEPCGRRHYVLALGAEDASLAPTRSQRRLPEKDKDAAIEPGRLPVGASGAPPPSLDSSASAGPAREPATGLRQLGGRPPASDGARPPTRRPVGFSKGTPPTGLEGPPAPSLEAFLLERLWWAELCGRSAWSTEYMQQLRKLPPREVLRLRRGVLAEPLRLRELVAGGDMLRGALSVLAVVLTTDTRKRRKWPQSVNIKDLLPELEAALEADAAELDRASRPSPQPPCPQAASPQAAPAAPPCDGGVWSVRATGGRKRGGAATPRPPAPRRAVKAPRGGGTSAGESAKGGCTPPGEAGSGGAAAPPGPMSSPPLIYVPPSCTEAHAARLAAARARMAERQESNEEPEGGREVTVPDPDFHSFDKDREEKDIQVGQVWALYSECDGMPSSYGYVTSCRGEGSSFRCSVTWLHHALWRPRRPCFGCGEFWAGPTEVQETPNAFSHRADGMVLRTARDCLGAPAGRLRVTGGSLRPRRAEVWAVFMRTSGGGHEREKRKYSVVYVSEVDEAGGKIRAAPLRMLPQYTTVYAFTERTEDWRLADAQERYSHRIPFHLPSGVEDPDVPPVVLTLDPAAIPAQLLSRAVKGVRARRSR